MKIVEVHVSTLSSSYPFSVNASLKRILQCLVKFICQHASKADNTDTKNKAIKLLVLLTLDLRTEFLFETVSKTLDKMIGETEADEHQKRVYLHVIENTYKLITNYTSVEKSSCVVKEKILHNCLKFYEKILEKSAGRQALETFFTGEKDLVKVLMSVSSPHMSQQYSTRVLHFFNKLFKSAEKSCTDPSLNSLCSSIGKIAEVESKQLQTWLKHIILGPNGKGGKEAETEDGWKDILIENKDDKEKVKKSLVQENSQLLQALTTFIVKQNSNVSEEVAVTILKALLPLGSQILSSPLEGEGFTDLMVVMTMLANGGTGKGHMHLFPAACDWVKICKQNLVQKETLEKLGNSEERIKNPIIIEASCCLFDYLGEVVNGLSNSHFASFRSVSPPWEGETPLDQETDWHDEVQDEDDSGEDSDEDSLCNKLCTFTITQKEFMNQHWYHCHTCRMLDGVGVCSVCARVCHKGHDLSYAKFGNFFCDCGAKEDISCQALVKRSPMSGPSDEAAATTITANVPSSSEQMLTSSLRRRTSSPVLIEKAVKKEKKATSIVKQLDGSKEWILNYLSGCSVTGIFLVFLL